MADKENQFQGVVESLLKGMDTVLSTKTVVGEATQIGDTIILPLVDVSFGVGAGAFCEDKKHNAAGGMGGGMMAFLQAELKSGADLLLDISLFKERATGADLIITGEGRIDKQSLMGKIPGKILEKGS